MIAKGNIESMHVRPIGEWGEGCGVGVRAGCWRIGGAGEAKLHRIRKVQGCCLREAGSKKCRLRVKQRER